MLLDEDLPGLLGQLSDRVRVPDFVAGAHRRHRRRRRVRAGSVVAMVALLATGTTAIARRASQPSVLRASAGSAALVPGGDYASVDAKTRDVVLVSADTGERTVVYRAPSNAQLGGAVVSPSRRYVYWLSYDPVVGVGSSWRIPFGSSIAQKLPSGPRPDRVKGGGFPDEIVVAPDDSEYAYPAPGFAGSLPTFVQQVLGGQPIEITGAPFDSDKAQLIGFYDDKTLLELSTSATASSIVATDLGSGHQAILDTRSVRTTPACVDSFAAAQLSDGRIASAPEICNVGVQPAVRVTGVPDGSVRSWTAPKQLFGYVMVSVNALGDGRLLVSYAAGNCAGPDPVVIFNPDGTSLPAYGLPMSSLHC